MKASLFYDSKYTKYRRYFKKNTNHRNENCGASHSLTACSRGGLLSPSCPHPRTLVRFVSIFHCQSLVCRCGCACGSCPAELTRADLKRVSECGRVCEGHGAAVRGRERAKESHREIERGERGGPPRTASKNPDWSSPVCQIDVAGKRRSSLVRSGGERGWTVDAVRWG